jgi:hypothetical protein
MATKARNWKGKKESGNIELALPSENTALVRRLQPEAFLTSGMIPDVLSDMVQKAIRSKKGLPPDATKQILDDPKKLRSAMQMMDEITCYVVVEPKCEMPPRCAHDMGDKICDEYFDTNDDRHQDERHPDYHAFTEGERDGDTLYVDEVSAEDKNFIFQFAMGGTADVERFRQELSGGMAGLPGGQNVQGARKRSARRK